MAYTSKHRELGILVPLYWDLQKSRIAFNNRIYSASPTHEDLEDIWVALNSLEADIKLKIEKTVPNHGIWDYWLKDVKGVGKLFTAQLITLITGKKHTPECAKIRGKYFSKRKKGEDLVKCSDCRKLVGTRCEFHERQITAPNAQIKCRYFKAKKFLCECPVMEMDRFPTISSLWKYAGLHVVDGKAPKKAKGTKIDWNPKLRMLCYNIGKSFVMHRTSTYRPTYDECKLKYTQENYPGYSKAHLDAMARRKTVKLFLAHLHVKWYELMGLEPTKPYVEEILGHTHIKQPE